MPYATIEAHRTFALVVDPYDISWGYKLRTHSTDTYGGRVVQILGVELQNLTISSVAGSGGYEYIQELKTFFREMGEWQREEETPAKFIFPPRNYHLSFWGVRFTYEDSVSNVVFPYQITGAIEQDLGGNLKKSILTDELKRLSEGVGYVRNKFNDPLNGELNINKWNELKAGADPVTGSNLTTPSPNAATPVAIPDDKIAETVINAALAYLGTPYAWGGGDNSGPTKGIKDGGTADSYGDFNKIGFDCSGLASYAYFKAGISVPSQTGAMWDAFPARILDKAMVRPGDLLLYSKNGSRSGIHHVLIYMNNDSNGTGVEALQSGDVVKISTNVWGGKRGAEFIGAIRPR